MIHIQEALRHENADLAIEWAEKNSIFLQEIGSTLEFRLHQVKYLQFVKSGKIPQALEYAKSHFYKFSSNQLKSIFLN
jgi:hypothetical protein